MALNQGDVFGAGIRILKKSNTEALDTNSGPVGYLQFVRESDGATIVPEYEPDGLATYAGPLSGARITVPTSVGPTGPAGATGPAGPAGATGATGPSADGTLIASLSSPVTIVGAVNTPLHVLSMSAGSSKRLVLVTSAYVSPDDGTTSGYHIRTAARVRRQAGGTHTVDQSIYLLNMEQSSTADAGFTGGASLVAFFLGVAGTTIVVSRADVWEL